MTVTVNTKWYVSSAGWTAMTAWTTVQAVTVGTLRRQSAPTAGNERAFVCIIAGTDLVSEPTWILTKGAKTAEAAGPTWMECTGLPGLNGDATNTPLSSANRSGAQVLGNMIQNNAGTFYFICTTAGATGAGEPTYTTTTGGTTTDSGCTWTCLGAPSAFTTAWAAPAARIGLPLTNTWATGGDTVYVSTSHAETGSATITWNRGLSLSGTSWTSAGIQVLCVANGGAIPPTAVTTGASVTVTGATSITIDLTLDIWGVAVNCGGTGSSGQTLALGTGTNGLIRMFNCALASSIFAFSSAQVNCPQVELVNCTLAFCGNTAGGIQFLGPTIWRDTPTALSSAGGSWPATLFRSGSRASASHIQNVDVSAFAGTNFMGSGNGGLRLVWDHCKLPSSFTPLGSAQALNSPGDVIMDFINCDSGGVTVDHWHYDYAGSVVLSTNVIATGGASDGTTSYAWKLVTGTLATWQTPLNCLPIPIWNPTTGANVTVTMLGAYNAAALPNNDQLWFDAVYLGTASSTNGTTLSATKASPLAAATALTASSVAWDTGATARANTTPYALGAVIKVATNPGRVFICTSPGTSNGSEPGGYATAVDGGSVTDNTATFRAVMRFSMAVTMSSPQPQTAGYITVYPRMGVASATAWINPPPALS